jgi:hypothetical protein
MDIATDIILLISEAGWTGKRFSLWSPAAVVMNIRKIE